MTYLKDKIVIYRGKHRLVDRMNNLMLSMATHALASRVVLQGKAVPFTDERGELGSNLFPLDVWLPLHSVIEYSLKGIAPDFIAVVFAPQRAKPYETPNTNWVKGTLHTSLANMISPIFVEFFETHKPWVKDKFGSIGAWPRIFAFARVMRNALSHDSKLHMKDAKAKDVEWHSLKYGLKDHGRDVYIDFGPGDFIILIFEMSDELDKLGCPIDLPFWPET